MKVVVDGQAFSVRVFLKIKFDGIKAYDDEAGVTLVTNNIITLFDVGVNKYFFVAFGTNRCGH